MTIGLMLIAVLCIVLSGILYENRETSWMGLALIAMSLGIVSRYLFGWL